MATHYATTAGLINTYGYVNGRPTHWVDPMGLQPTGSDIALCAVRPFDCGEVRDCADEALQKTQQKFGTQGHNDAGDAYRHCYWSCCMAKAIGSEGAEDFGTSHENYWDNPECEMQMDLSNNALGRGSGPNGPSTDCDTHCSMVPLMTSPPGSCAPACKYVYTPPPPPPSLGTPVSRSDIGGGV